MNKPRNKRIGIQKSHFVVSKWLILLNFITIFILIPNSYTLFYIILLYDNNYYIIIYTILYYYIIICILLNLVMSYLRKSFFKNGYVKDFIVTIYVFQKCYTIT
jgi:predicted membrane channel-forming protein YqfA (hemolysin III family)